MELRFQAGGPESWSADAVIVFLSEDEKLEKAYPELLEAAPWMSIAPGMRDFHGKKGEMGLLYGPPAHPLPRAVVVGLGKLDALTYAETLEELRKGAGAAAVRCRELGVGTLALPVSGLARFNADVERTIEEIVCAAMLGLWRNKAFKSKEPEDADPRWLALLFCDASVPDFPRLAARRGETHAEAVILARNLANTPANSLTPEGMEEERRLAFVAMTRAKERLFLSEAGGRDFDGSPRYPSRFLLDIDEQYLTYDKKPREGLIAAARDYIHAHTHTPRPAENYLQPGTKVHHFVFGDGVVVEIDSAKEAHLIQFEGMDTPRRLSVRAKLEIIKKEVKQE